MKQKTHRKPSPRARALRSAAILDGLLHSPRTSPDTLRLEPELIDAIVQMRRDLAAAGLDYRG